MEGAVASGPGLAGSSPVPLAVAMAAVPSQAFPLLDALLGGRRVASSTGGRIRIPSWSS